MRVFMRSGVLVIFVLAIFLAACGQAVQPASTQPEPTSPADSPPLAAATSEPDPADPPAASTPQATAQPQETLDPLAGCPREEEGKSLYVSEINGFCFLYPAGFTIEPDEMRPDEVVKLVGSREEAGPKQMEVATVTLWVASNGPSDVPTSAAYADKGRQVYVMPGEMAEFSQQSAQIGGQPAEIVDGFPGMIFRRIGFVVANGYKYTVTISPQPGFVGDLDEPVSQAWETVTSSIHFFPPLIQHQTTLASQVCPAPRLDQKVMINEAEGFCYVYPDDFDADPISSYGRLTGGPILANMEGFGDVQTSLTVGPYPLVADQRPQSPRDMLDTFTGYDPNSVEDRTIGGERAIVYRYDPPSGPWASRQAVIVTEEGLVYTIVNDPWEPDRWPENIPYFDSVWETVTGSLTFFTPWR